METLIFVDGVTHTFVTFNNTTVLRFSSVATPERDTSAKVIKLPSIWLVTRRDGTPLFALRPLEGDKAFRVLTAETLYEERIQWFESLADNYREMLWINPECSAPTSTCGAAFKHFYWGDIINFSIVERMSLSFASRLPGDWKRSPVGGDSYLMVMVGGDIYWADAIGQIPFAVNTYRKYFQEVKDKDLAIIRTVKTGIEYGDGNPWMPRADSTNEYDNYMVLRGAVWAAENFIISVGRRDIEGFVPRSIEQTASQYVAVSDAYLRNACGAELVNKYGVWR